MKLNIWGILGMANKMKRSKRLPLRRGHRGRHQLLLAIAVLVLLLLLLLLLPMDLVRA